MKTLKVDVEHVDWNTTKVPQISNDVVGNAAKHDIETISKRYQKGLTLFRYSFFTIHA